MNKTPIYSSYMTKEEIDVVVENYKKANGRVPDKNELDDEIELIGEYEYMNFSHKIAYYFDAVHDDEIFIITGEADSMNKGVRESKKGGKLFHGADEIFSLLEEYENYEVSEISEDDSEDSEKVFTIEGFNLDLSSGEVLSMCYTVRRLNKKGVSYVLSNKNMDRKKLHKNLLDDKYSRNLEFEMECEGCDAF